MLQLSHNPLLFFLEYQEWLPPCIYHIHWNAEDVLLFLDKITPLCKSVASSKKGRNILLSNILVRQLRVRYLNLLRRKWSYNILMEEDWKCDDYRSTAPQWACFWMCFVNLPISNYTLPPWDLQEASWEKKESSNLFFSQIQHWSTKKIPSKYTSHIYHLIHHQGLQVDLVDWEVALMWWWKVEATALAGRHFCRIWQEIGLTGIIN